MFLFKFEGGTRLQGAERVMRLSLSAQYTWEQGCCPEKLQQAGGMDQQKRHEIQWGKTQSPSPGKDELSTVLGTYRLRSSSTEKYLGFLVDGGGLAEREPAAEQANSIFDSTYRSRGFICLLNILLFNVIYPNFLTCFCIYKQWAHCLLPFLLLSILRIFASSTLGKFPFFWRVNLYICEICCFISAWEVGISGNWGFFTWNYCPSHRNNNYYSKYLYLKWREKEVFTWC